MKHRTEITFETRETVVISGGSQILMSFCTGCGGDVPMASPQTAAAVSNLTEREMFRLLEHNKIHFSESGRILICLRSVSELSG